MPKNARSLGQRDGRSERFGGKAANGVTPIVPGPLPPWNRRGNLTNPRPGIQRCLKVLVGSTKSSGRYSFLPVSLCSTTVHRALKRLFYWRAACPPALAISPALTNLSCTYRSSKGLRR
ncbi:hypothetical protein EMIT051CA3_60243 [Pseudomonas chlororaphis]